MTATPSVDRAAASRLVAALEHAWTAIRNHHPDVPQVVIVVASGSDPRGKRLNLGHVAACRWQLTSSDQPGDRAEVLSATLRTGTGCPSAGRGVATCHHSHLLQPFRRGSTGELSMRGGCGCRSSSATGAVMSAGMPGG